MTQLMLKAGWLYSATGVPPVPDAAVLVSDGRIAQWALPRSSRRCWTVPPTWKSTPTVPLSQG